MYYPLFFLYFSMGKRKEQQKRMPKQTSLYILIGAVERN